MLREKYIRYYLANIVLDGIAVAISLILAYYIRDWSVWCYKNIIGIDMFQATVPARIYPLANYTWLLVIMVPLWPVLMDLNGAYSSMKFDSLRNVSIIIFKSVVQATIIMIMLLFLFKIEGISRLFIVTVSFISFIILLLKELLVRLYFKYVKRSEFGFRNILVIGRGDECAKIIKTLNGFSFWGLRVIGIVTSCVHEKKGDIISGVTVLGSLPDVSDIFIQYPIDEVIFTSHPIELPSMRKILEECEELGIKTLIPLNFFDLKIAKPEFETLNDIPILSFTTTSTKVIDLFFKYMLDRILAFILIIMLSPFMLIIALLIKLNSKGPILFRQTRVGLYSRPFIFYKFRSMYIDAEEKLQTLKEFNEMEGPVFKMKNDPRITSVGRFIRKTSIDELPQLFNVLKGEMSLVGPRPPLPKEVKQYQRWQRRKLSMKPGITCIWQISGRNEVVSFDEWMRMDLQYIDHWSLYLDIKILLKTVYVVLAMRGAH